jgi:hypothetical protein
MLVLCLTCVVGKKLKLLPAQFSVAWGYIRMYVPTYDLDLSLLGGACFPTRHSVPNYCLRGASSCRIVIFIAQYHACNEHFGFGGRVIRSYPRRLGRDVGRIFEAAWKSCSLSEVDKPRCGNVNGDSKTV